MWNISASISFILFPELSFFSTVFNSINIQRILKCFGNSLNNSVKLKASYESLFTSLPHYLYVYVRLFIVKSYLLGCLMNYILTGTVLHSNFRIQSTNGFSNSSTAWDYHKTSYRPTSCFWNVRNYWVSHVLQHTWNFVICIANLLF